MYVYILECMRVKLASIRVRHRVVHSSYKRKKLLLRVVSTDTETGMLPGVPGSAICVQKFDLMIHIFCNSHYVSHFAAFFIVART